MTRWYARPALLASASVKLETGEGHPGAICVEIEVGG